MWLLSQFEIKWSVRFRRKNKTGWVNSLLLPFSSVLLSLPLRPSPFLLSRAGSLYLQHPNVLASRNTDNRGGSV
jgi:hypothetical protein